MAEINRLVRADDFANTGIGDSPIIPKHITGMFIVPKDFEITKSNAITLKTFLKGAANKADKKDRILPVHHFVGVEDGSEDPTTNTLGYGGISVTREGNYDLTFQLSQGGMGLQKALRKYNRRPMHVMLYDADGMLFGSKSGDVIKGIPVELFYASPIKLSDGSAEAVFNIRVVFKPTYFNENLSFIATAKEGFMLQEIEGLMDIELEQIERTLGVLKLKLYSGYGTINVGAEYATELSEVGLWIATNPTDGSNIVISSVTVNTAGVATVTLATNDDAIITLAGVTVLETAGIIGYESLTLLSVKPE